MNQKIGIVSVLYNSESVLREFFITLNEQNYKNFKLYLIDNNSTDNSVKLSKKLSKECFFEVEFIENNENYGISRGNNQGIKRALEEKCDYVLLSNNDLVLKEENIQILLEESLKKNRSLVTPKIYYYGTNKIWVAGGDISFYKGITSHYGKLEEDRGNYDISKEVNYAPTCFMLIKSNIFEEVGLMDEDFFVYFDDTDFILRCLKSGYKIYYTHRTDIEHKISTSTGGSESPFSIYFLTKNRIIFIKKHYSIFYKFCSYNFFFITRIIKYAKYNKEQRAKLIKGINDGLRFKGRK